MRPTRRHVTPALFAAALALGAGAAATSSASAASVAVSGDDGRPVAISPGSPPALRNLRPQAVVTPDPGTRYSVAVTGPDGRPAAAPVTCADAAQPATLQVAYRGNGAYGVALTTYAATDTGCAGPLGPATTYPFTIAGRVTLGGVGRFLLRDPGSATVRVLSLPVNADPGSQSREVRFKLNGTTRRDGALKGRSTSAPFANGAAALKFPGPGTYTVVARDAADGIQTPWSAPIRVRVVAPFDLSAIRYPDRSGPRFRVFAQIREGADATGIVSVAIARGTAPSAASAAPASTDAAPSARSSPREPPASTGCASATAATRS